MKLFPALYDRVISWSKHKHAVYYLSALSFAESSFFPIPPDVVLAPMSLATPKRAILYATITTITSVAGGILGYVIGYFFIEQITPWLQLTAYWPSYQLAIQWFENWGFLAIFLAGFSPIPYKVFTIAAGAFNMALIPFIIASFIGRGGRFYLVAIIMAWGGKKYETKIRSYINKIGYATVAISVLAVIVYVNLN